MGQGMRVTVNSAMRARDVSRIRPQDEVPKPTGDAVGESAAQPAAKETPQPTRLRRAEKRRLAKRRAAKT